MDDTLQTLEMTVTTAGRPYSLRYFDRPGPGPAILYIHGLGCSKADFMEMAAAPELQSFRLISADHPGYGDSPSGKSHCPGCEAQKSSWLAEPSGSA